MNSNWDIEDLNEKSIADVRPIRNEIRREVYPLIKELDKTTHF
jgi:hypothetical protein